MTKSPQAKMVVGLAALLGTGALFGGAQAATTDASALVLDQAAANKTVSIDYVYLPQDGYVAIYRSDETGIPSGPPIGSANLAAGDHRAVEVPLSAQLQSGERLWVSLYHDADGTPTFEPGTGDQPIWSKDQQPSESGFVVR